MQLSELAFFIAVDGHARHWPSQSPEIRVSLYSNKQLIQVAKHATRANEYDTVIQTLGATHQRHRKTMDPASLRLAANKAFTDGNFEVAKTLYSQ